MVFKMVSLDLTDGHPRRITVHTPPRGNPETRSSTRFAGRRTEARIPHERLECKLVAKNVLSRDVRLFRFALPSEDQVLGLPVGKPLYLRATIDGKPRKRPYIPTSGSLEEAGYFELVVKIYHKNPHSLSQHLDSLPLGSVLHVEGPPSGSGRPSWSWKLLGSRRVSYHNFSLIALR